MSKINQNCTYTILILFTLLCTPKALHITCLQDEYATAAYKTVELDTFLDDRAIQHREVQDNESELFKTYFPKGISYVHFIIH